MQFPESWLRTLVNPAIGTDELSHRLTMAGLEVEETNPVAPEFSGVVVARIDSVEPHPNADKLRVCRVDAGQGALLQIVCGAPNAAAGIKVPLAMVGACLPGGMAIGVAKMRGVESSGMLCSARELGLSQDHAGLMILADDAPVGASLRDALGLDDTLFTLKLTPNRADCLSILGVAREVAALTGAALREPVVERVQPTLTEVLPVRVHAPDLCGRFAGRIVRGVNARAKSPAWLVERLERCGQRSVTALVDISNYIMLLVGRPTHVFDLDRIPAQSLDVRWARAGESLTLLNDQTITLESDMGVICSGDTPESLAGIMGGASTAVSLDTTNIYMEAAFWWPEAIAGRTRRLKISSEAGHRFERGVDFESGVAHLELMTRMIIDICGGEVGPIDDQIINLPRREPVRMRLARCRKVLGIDVGQQQIAQVFRHLGLAFEQEGDDFIVTPPSYRFDLTIEEDLIEEVARIVGFESSPAAAPIARAVMRAQTESRRSALTIRGEIAALDYQEVVNFSFVDAAWETEIAGCANPIRLLNPIASHLAVMRSTLMPGLVANVRYNANRKQSRVRVFELGRVFARDASVADGPLTVAGVHQPQHLAGAAWGPAVDEQWGQPTRAVDFFDVKRDVESLYGVSAAQLTFEAQGHPALHPGRSARILLAGKPVGWIGELHPRWVQAQELASAPVLFEVTLDSLQAVPLPAVAELSRQPVVQRDLAVWVPLDVAVGAMLETIQSTISSDPALAVVRQVRLFDVWRDQAAQAANEKSLAFRFWLQDADVTLDDARVDECIGRIRVALESAHQARPR